MGICYCNLQNKRTKNYKEFKHENDKKSIIKINLNNDEINSKIKINEIAIKEKEESERNNNELNITLEQSEKILKQSKIYICKIKSGKNKYGTGFLCKIPFPDKNNALSVLMTNHHVITKEELLLKDKEFEISFDDGKIKKIINITPERKIYSIMKEESYDLTIIEIFPEEDKIFHFFEIETLDVTKKFENESIYILQYPFIIEKEDDGNEIKRHNCSISYGKICKIKNNEIFHDCSTAGGSSGGPILLLKNFNLIGIHKCYYKNINLNIGTSLKEPIEEFNSLFSNKKIKNNYVNCIICEYYIKNEEEFDLLYDYNKQKLDSHIDYEINNLYNIGKNKKKLLEKIINIYVDEQLIKFNFKYKTKKKNINVKFIFNEKIDDLSFLFYKCNSLQSVDLSPFNASNVTDMSYMFSGCESLQSIDLFSFNTSNVRNMRSMFCSCNSLETIDFSSFDTTNATNMSQMLYNCTSIRRLDLTNFNTINVSNMSKMFANCYTLKFLYFNSFKTNNVTDMSQIFSKCSSIKSLDLSNFNTSKVENMNGMFEFCSQLELVNLSSFDTFNTTNMGMMFMCCIALKSLDLSSFNTINVIDMHSMFFGDTALESLDLSKFNTIKAKNMKEMFHGCFKLKKIKSNDNKIKNMNNILPFNFYNY